MRTSKEQYKKLKDMYRNILKEKDNRFIYACKNCNQALSIDINFKRDKTWYCYRCKTEMLNKGDDKPITRKRKSVGMDPKVKTNASDSDISMFTKEVFLHKLNEMWAEPFKVSPRILRNTAFISLLWLTGCRVSEVLGRPEKGLTRKQARDTNQWEVEPIKLKQIYIDNHDGEECLFVQNIPVLKRKMTKSAGIDKKIKYRYPVRQCIIAKFLNPEIIEYFMKYIRKIPKTEDYLEEPLFNFGVVQANTIIKDFCGWYPHFLRHARMQDLVVRFGFDSLQLQAFAGWGSAAMAEKYTHLDGGIVATAMIRNYKERIIKNDD